MAKGVSIILCCYNSVARLPVTLRALHDLIIPDEIEVEILLIDNNSTDETSAHAINLWNEFQNQIPLLVLHENKQGIGYARLCGVGAAKYDLILFVDDDNELAPDYLLRGLNFLLDKPDIGVLGGISVGVLPGPLPPWMNPGFPFKSLLTAIAVSTPERAVQGYLDTRQDYLVTAGTFFRKKVFTPVLHLDYGLLLVGRIEEQLLSGEDEEFCCWAKMMGLRLYRLDTLQFKHHIAEGRLNKSYFERLFFGFGYGSVILDTYREVLQGKVQLPTVGGLSRRAKVKIAILSSVYPVARFLFHNKSFKINLLIQFQRGVLQYLKDRPNLKEVQDKVLNLAKSLRA